MNAVATADKNVQTTTQAEPLKKADEIRVISTPATSAQPSSYISSLAGRKPTAKYGGRHLRYRDHANLKPWQVHDLRAADALANATGVPLNTFITICWGATFDGEAHMPRNFRRGVKRMSQWLRDNGVLIAWLYVHENPGDIKLNSHILVHVPARLQKCISERAAVWFGALDGGVRVDPRCRPGRKDTRLQYMTKGAPFLVCKQASDGWRSRGGEGTIEIKRAGVSKLLRTATPFLRVAA